MQAGFQPSQNCALSQIFAY